MCYSFGSERKFGNDLYFMKCLNRKLTLKPEAVREAAELKEVPIN